MRQVRFSMRSWFGKFCFVLAKYRHIWVANGSSLARSSGLSLIPARPSRKPEKACVLVSLPCASSMVLVRSKRNSFREVRIPGFAMVDLAVLLAVLSKFVIEGEMERASAVGAASSD